MFKTRNYPDTPDTVLAEFDHTDPDLAETVTSPFPAIIFTLDGQLLGYGRVLGRLEEAGETVIEVIDPNSPNGKVHLFDFECLWGVCTPEVVAKYGNPSHQTMSAYDYIRFIDGLNQSQNMN